MNLQQFSKLKVGDRIENPMTQSSGVVTETTDQGIRVRWGERIERDIEFTYTVMSTAWMHWALPPRDCTEGPCYRDDCRQGDQCLGGDYDKIVAGTRD